ncbi:MAG TPA: RNA polymerase sigma factor [Planctomycetes bacterium]|nr:RNA polymerase sigma factor [Planctomycetota bacterium]
MLSNSPHASEVLPVPSQPAHGLRSVGENAPDDGVLGRWPGVARALRRAGVELEQGPRETGAQFENRIATALMALHRDTRTSESFEALYAFTRASVESWIRGLLARCGSRRDSAELLQDTFVNVYRYPGGFRDEHNGSFRVWVRTIAGNLIRRAGARGNRPIPLAFTGEEPEPEDRNNDPARLASTEEQRDRLRGAYGLFLAHYHRAWMELSQRDRRALHLVEVEGLRYSEAAEILNVGPSNMKMIIFRARKRMARRMRQAMNAAVFAPSSEGDGLRRAV